MIGRTHGIWAEPTTFGLKLATWAFEIDRDRSRLKAAAESVSVGKISGAVGTYAHTPPAIEEYVCERMGLGVEPASSQITHRDRHAEYLSVLALVGSSLERFATEIRHLQRSEVGEARESFGKGQKGSSAMPHKRNPIASENVTGLARLLRGYASVGLREHRTVARTRYLALIGGASGLARRLDSTRLRLGPDDQADRQSRRRHRSDVAATSMRPVAWCSLKRCCWRSSRSRVSPATPHTGSCNATRCAPGMRACRSAQLLADDGEAALHPDVLDRCFSAEYFLRNSGVVFDRLESI